MKHLINFPSILVIDDEALVLKVTQSMLQQIGFNHVETMDNAQHALSIIENYDVILLDLNMPEMDGLEFIRHLSEIQYTGKIILFSAEDSHTLHMAQHLAKNLKLEIPGIINKPLQQQELINLLSQHPVKETIKGGIRHIKEISPELLSAAIKNNEIVPWFQPKLDVINKKPVGVEALARWPNSQIGPIFPDQFIPLAEEHGLIDDLTISILKQTSNIQKQWRSNGIQLKVAINLSMQSLQNQTFTDFVDQCISSNQCNPENLQLEITESLLMQDIRAPLETLLRFRMKKVSLSIDDFGTGFSNLSQLRDLPFDELKLDRSYVNLDGDKERTKIILQSTVELAKRLNMKVVAEGVETLDDWKRVEELGCDQVQGYFVAKPMPAQEIEHWINSWASRKVALFNL